MIEESAGLYVHFPYCVSICPYCDFDRQATGFGSIPKYVEAVAAEIRASRRRAIHSIFFGGGTPSLMEATQVGLLIRTAGEVFDVLPGCEVTIEANPGECNPERLAGFRAAGVNRLSIGVQSLDDRTLEHLGRRHSAREARAAVDAAREAGFDNLNLDLMLGLAGMTTGSWLETLDQAIELRPEHLSCYILTVDERVPMGRDVARGRLQLPHDDEVAEQYEATGRRLAAAGYEQYEISNWARPGRPCRHNLTYWRDEPYVGVGAGAAGWTDGLRTKNTPSPRRYMRSVTTGHVARVEAERPDRVTRMRDFLATGLRLREGIDARRFESCFGAELDEVLGSTLAELVAAGYLERRGPRLRVGPDRILVTSEIVLRLDEAVAAWAAADDSAERGGASGDASTQSPAEGDQLLAAART